MLDAAMYQGRASLKEPCLPGAKRAVPVTLLKQPVHPPRRGQERNKSPVMGTPNREPEEYSRNIIEYEDPGGYILLCSYYILGVPCLGFPLKSV